MTSFFNKSLKPGFSMMELMVALLIIGIIAGLALPRLGSMLGKGKRTSTVNSLKIVKQGIMQYEMTVGKYPEKLEDLVVKPEGTNNWDGPYVGNEDVENPEVPRDAWGEELVYKLNPRGSKPPFELYSLGDPKKEEDRIDAK